MILIWTDAQNQELSNGVSIVRNGQKLSLIHRFEVATTPFFWVGLSILLLSLTQKERCKYYDRIVHYDRCSCFEDIPMLQKKYVYVRVYRYLPSNGYRL